MRHLRYTSLILGVSDQRTQGFSSLRKALTVLLRTAKTMLHGRSALPGLRRVLGLAANVLVCALLLCAGCRTIAHTETIIPLDISFAGELEDQRDFSVYYQSVEALRTVDIYLEKISDRRGYYPEACFKFYDADGITIDRLRDRNTKFATEGVGFIGKLYCPVPRETRSIEVEIVAHRGIFRDELAAIETGMPKEEVKKKLGDPQLETKAKMTYPGVKFKRIDIVLDDEGKVKSVNTTR